MVKVIMSDDEACLAAVDEITLEVPVEPDREEDEQHVESGGGSLMNFLTGNG